EKRRERGAVCMEGVTAIAEAAGILAQLTGSRGARLLYLEAGAGYPAARYTSGSTGVRIMQSKYWLAALALGVSLQTGASSFVVTTDGLVNTVKGTSDAISSTLGDDQVVREARDDAASFAASARAIRCAHLAAAF